MARKQLPNVSPSWPLQGQLQPMPWQRSQPPRWDSDGHSLGHSRAQLSPGKPSSRPGTSHCKQNLSWRGGNGELRVPASHDNPCRYQSPFLCKVSFRLPTRPEQQPSAVRDLAGSKARAPLRAYVWVDPALQANRGHADGMRSTTHYLEHLPEMEHPQIHPLGQASSTGQFVPFSIFSRVWLRLKQPRRRRFWSRLLSAGRCAVECKAVSAPHAYFSVHNTCQEVIWRSAPLLRVTWQTRSHGLREIRDTAAAAQRFPALHTKPRGLPIFPVCAGFAG